jgi:ABC-2 type transport system permease protein
VSLLGADLRALYAASLKEWRIMRRYPTVFIGILFWPLVLPGVYVLQANGFGAGDSQALHAFAARTGTLQVAGFLYIGGAIYMWLSVVLWGPGSALREEQTHGSLEQLFLTPVSRLVLLFGSAPAYLAQAFWMFLVIGTVLATLFHVPIGAGTVLRALIVIAISVPAFLGLGGLFSALVLRFRGLDATVQVARGVCQLLCGMTFPIVVLPVFAQAIAVTLPPTHVIADIRSVFLSGASIPSLAPDLLLLTGLSALMCVMAALVFRRCERFFRRNGTLGQY